MKAFKSLGSATGRNFALLFGAALFFWCSLTALLPTLPLYIESLGATAQQVGWVMSSFAIGLILSRGLLGYGADQRGRKWALLIGAIVGCLAPFGYLMAKSLPLIVLVRSIHGVSIAGFTTGYSALVADLAPRAHRGELIGYMSVVVPVGMALGPALGGYTAAGLGYQVLFIISGVLGLFAIILTTQIEEKWEYQQPQATVKGNFFRQTFASFQLGAILGKRSFSTPALVMLVTGILFGSLTIFLPAFIRDGGIGINAGLFYTTAAIASFSARILSGPFSDRWGRGIFITLSLVSYSSSLILLSLAHSPQMILLAALIEGSGVGTLIPMVIALLSDRTHPQERGIVYAVCTGGFDVGVALGGPIAGFLVVNLGYRTMFALASVIGFLGFLTFVAFSSKDFKHSLRFALGRDRQDLLALEN